MAFDDKGNLIEGSEGDVTPPAGEAAAPAEDAGSLPAEDDALAADAEDAGDDAGKKKGGVAKRISELTTARRTAERDAAYWRGVAEGARTVPVAQGTPQADPDAQELDPNDFDSDAEYLKAKSGQIERRLERKFAARIHSGEETQTVAVIKTSTEKARAKYTDFDVVAKNPAVPITREMFEAAVGESLGEVLYFLGKNPDVADRISHLPPVQQAKEIGKIEDRLSAAPAHKATNAPKPPARVGGGGSSPARPDGQKIRAELHAEWEANRRKRLGVK